MGVPHSSTGIALKLSVTPDNVLGAELGSLLGPVKSFVHEPTTKRIPPEKARKVELLVPVFITTTEFAVTRAIHLYVDEDVLEKVSLVRTFLSILMTL